MSRQKPELKSILDLNLGEAERLFVEMGEQKFRARQLFSWIFERHVADWQPMSNLPLKFSKRLASEWAIMTSRVEEVRTGKDGTSKLLIRLFDGLAIESVHIPEEKRGTVCLSTQVGCPVGCSFCASGKRGLKRNLSSGEILEQVLHIISTLAPGGAFRNVVLMGAGEPMRNYDNVMRAVRAMIAPWGFGIGARRITISTVGDVKGIERLAKEGLQVNLAISLHGADDPTRGKVIPAAKMAPVSTVVEAARSYFAATRRRVSFEYVLVDGVNSSLRQARKLGQLLRGFPCFVNLIPLNPVEGISLKPPSGRCVRGFLRELERMGIPAALRESRGSDISAACGQLAGRATTRRTKPDSADPQSGKM